MIRAPHARWRALADHLSDEIIAAAPDEIAAAAAETGLGPDILAGQVGSVVRAALTAAEEGGPGLPPAGGRPDDQPKP